MKEKVDYRDLTSENGVVVYPREARKLVGVIIDNYRQAQQRSTIIFITTSLVGAST